MDRKKSLRILFTTLVLAMVFLVGSPKTAYAESVGAAALDQKKYQTFEKVLTDAIGNWKGAVDFIDCGTFSGDEFQDYYYNYILEHPKFFYASIKNYTTANGAVSANITYTDNARSEQQAYEKAVSAVLKSVNKKWSDYEKIVFVNDYLSVTCAYDTTLTKTHNADAYGVLVNKTAVCQGYSMAFMDIMDRLSIPCEYVNSRQLNHGWNMVKVGGKWYHVDVTWDDPVADMKGRAGHGYLLKSTKYMAANKHNASDYSVTGGINITSANSTKYDKYFWDNIDRPFIYYAGKWYGIDKKSGNLCQYAYTAKKAGFVKKKTLLTISDKWNVWNSTSFYTDCYASLAQYKNNLYYSTPDKIYCYNLKTNTQKVIYTNKKDGYIYGIVLNGKKLNYYLMKNPGEDICGKGTVKVK